MAGQELERKDEHHGRGSRVCPAESIRNITCCCTRPSRAALARAGERYVRGHMPKWLQAVMGVFAVVGVAFVAMLLKSSFSAFEKSCDTFAVMVVPSPSGKLFAQMENEICDGRTQLESVVWISTDASSRVGSRQWSVFRAPSAQRRGNDYTPL